MRQCQVGLEIWSYKDSTRTDFSMNKFWNHNVNKAKIQLAHLRMEDRYILVVVSMEYHDNFTYIMYMHDM